MEHTTLKNKIEQLLSEVLPEAAYRKVTISKFWNHSSIWIELAAADFCINNVGGQLPQKVVLSLDPDTMELESSHTDIYRDPDRNNPRERFLAMAGERIPFRKPQRNEKAVMKAIERFCVRWIETMRDHRETLRYREDQPDTFNKCFVDYDKLLNL